MLLLPCCRAAGTTLGCCCCLFVRSRGCLQPSIDTITHPKRSHTIPHPYSQRIAPYRTLRRVGGAAPSVPLSMEPKAQHLLFTCIHLSGHISPALSVAAACRRRQLAAAAGAASASTVRFAAFSRCRAKVEAAGVEFVDLGEPTPEEDAMLDSLMKASSGTGPRPMAAGVNMFVAFEKIMTPRLRKAIESGAGRGATALVGDFTTLVSGV